MLGASADAMALTGLTSLAGLAVVVAAIAPAIFSVRVTVTGTDVDKQTYEAMLEKCAGDSPAFAELVDILERSGKNIKIDVGRSQPKAAWGGDAGLFDPTHLLDLDDFEALPNPTRDPATGRWVFPPGIHPQSSTLCQFLAHELWEWYMEEFLDAYEPSHQAAKAYEERIRRDLGQTGGPIEHQYQDDEVVTVYRNGTFFVEAIPMDGATVTGPPTVTATNVVCVANCLGQSRRYTFGAATCAACERLAVNLCRRKGKPLGNFVCRTR